MNGKGKQFVPHGLVVEMAFPGGVGYGTANERDTASVVKDLASGYISRDAAIDDYGLTAAQADDVLVRAKQGQPL